MPVSLLQLWLPILLAGIACHIIGFLVWVVLPHHRSDFKAIPEEESVRKLLRGKVTPGQYLTPYGTHESMQTPEMKAKRDEGPNIFFTVLPNGMGNMLTMQAKNVGFHALVSFFVAYLGTVTLMAGAEYLKVFQVCGTAAVLAYAFQWGHQVIWFGKPFKTGMKDAIDGLVMGLITAGIFGWLWPR